MPQSKRAQAWRLYKSGGSAARSDEESIPRSPQISQSGAQAHGPENVEIIDYQRNEAMTRRPVHPGEILADELEALGLSSAELSRTLDVPAIRISQIIAGKRSITADTALRLGRYFGSSADLWMNLQSIYDLDLAANTLGKAINKIPQRELTGARA
jgi:addiction module HigA family antidote